MVPGEFAAANAIIDALCGHLSQLEGGRCEYETVFAAIHQRRLNWIPILQMQKYFSIADVTAELQKVIEEKTRLGGIDKIEEINVSSPVEEKTSRFRLSALKAMEMAMLRLLMKILAETIHQTVRSPIQDLKRFII